MTRESPKPASSAAAPPHLRRKTLPTSQPSSQKWNLSLASFPPITGLTTLSIQPFLAYSNASKTSLTPTVSSVLLRVGPESPIVSPQSQLESTFDGCFLRCESFDFFNQSVDSARDTVNCATDVLLDNAVDEIQNGATFVVIDKTTNPRDGNPALLIQVHDDGGGMDPETIRRCMSFGFSDKKMKSAIGQYGNGFKTSSMRLGADVVVFTCHLRERTLTQSVDYEFNESTTKLEPILSYGQEHFSSNLSVLLQWSPYPTEEIMLKQFDDIGNHGTKIVIDNLWLNDNGAMELDFDLDAEDIRVIADPKLLQTGCCPNQVYSSILYLRAPQSFKIVLRGRVVEHHNIANDLKFPEFILYKPHGGNMEAVVTTIGFLKEAPRVNIHGFNVYHKNRLILEFPLRIDWLSANEKISTSTQAFSGNTSSVTGNAGPLSSAVESFEVTVATPSKRKEQNPAGELEHVKRQTGSRSYSTDTQHIGVNQPTPEYENQLQDDEFTSLMQENEKLQTQQVQNRLLELERSEECLTLKVRQLRKELGDIQSEYARLVAESESMNIVKDEKTING
ncbi:unnamed protein product [Camellia sinensis]